MSQLQPPPISNEPSAKELLRVWAGPDLPQEYVIEPMWDDPGAWGLLLVDIARHASKAYAAAGEISEEEALARIKSLFDAEWNASTDNPQQL